METKQESILVTGASGNIGTEVVKQLLSDAPEVSIKAAVHSSQNVKKVKYDDRVKVIQIDYKEPQTVREALKDVDKLFLLTPMCQMRPSLRIMR
jgi:uncharacterized protein YbjT (DUF2867 family)